MNEFSINGGCPHTSEIFTDRALIWLIYPTGNFIGSWFALWEN